jgi:hypothetical protein
MISINDLNEEQRLLERRRKEIEKLKLKKEKELEKESKKEKKPLAIEYKKERKTRNTVKEPVKNIKSRVIRQPKKDRYNPVKGSKTNKTSEETYEIEEIIRLIRDNPEGIERIDFGRSTFGVITRK